MPKNINQTPALPSNLHTTKRLPDSLVQLIRETYREAEFKFRPAPVPVGQRAVAERYLADLEHEIRPADRDWLVGRILALLAHYWMPDMSETLQQAVGNDWANVLGKMPRQAIEAACREYLSTDTRARPTPGQVLKLAEAEIAEQIEQRYRLRACLHYERPAERERRAATVTMAEALAAGEAAKTHLRAAIAEEESDATQ